LEKNRRWADAIFLARSLRRCGEVVAVTQRLVEIIIKAERFLP